MILVKHKDKSFLATLLLCMITCSSYAHPILDTNDTSPSTQGIVSTIKEGDGFASAELYTQASARYLEALHSLAALNEKDHNTEQLAAYTQYQLADSYIRHGDNAKAIPILQEIQSHYPTQQALYLLGLAHKNLQQYPEAKETFNRYLSASANPLPQANEAKFQLGHIDFLQGNFDAASKQWKPLITSKEKDNAVTLARLYLARISILQGNEKEALEILTPLLSTKQPDTITYQTNYLLGTAYYLLGDDAQAFPSFEKSLPESNPQASIWYEHTQKYLRQDVASATFEERSSLFSRLIQQATTPEDTAISWFMKGKNDYDEAINLQKSSNSSSIQLFSQAAEAFRQSADLFPQKQTSQISNAKKFEALSLSHLNTEASDRRALTLLQEITTLTTTPSQDQTSLLYLEGIISARLIPTNDLLNESPQYIQAVKALESAATHKDSPYSSMALKDLGALYFRAGNYIDAERAYLQLAETHQGSQLCGEGWFWAGKCAQKIAKNQDTIRERFKHVYENYPNSPYAAEAYLSMYTIREYLQGDRTPIKHLQYFTDNFPDSPLQIQAHYLLGMDLKRDRKTAEGKWLRKRNLTEAIDAFQEVDNLFTKFMEEGNLPEDMRAYFIKVRYQATLERALANLAIANDSIGAKKAIYLEYAEEVFKTLIDDLGNPNTPYSKLLQQERSLSPIYEEAVFGLAQTNIKANHDDKAEKILTDLQSKYQQMHVNRSYYLSRSWYERGMIAMRKQQPKMAIQYLHNAEEAAKGDLLSTDQKLDLWIQEGLCYRNMGDYDRCVLLLSKAINDDAVSSLRLKAMFLRAETYEQQGRQELARKQLESLAKKGGYWGKEAKQKMDGNNEH